MFASVIKSALLVLVALSGIASANPVHIDKRAWPRGTVTCGTAKHTLANVKAATARGYSLMNSPIGTNSYPHKFNNREGLDMWCTGKTAFNEFPILSSGALYSGASPGADRVVFANDGTYCAVITHTGAGGNNFLSCDGD